MRGLLRRILPVRPMAPATLEIEGREIPVAFRRNAQAKRLIVRLDRKGEGVVVTLPHRASKAEALDFTRRSMGWIAQQLAKRMPKQTLAPGESVPLRGIPHQIHPAPARRGLVACDSEGCSITVPGDAAHAPRRLRDWLMVQARHDLAEASQRHARAMAVAYRRLAVRDQKSRWGSCSAEGALSYSWRLVLAPPFVLDYVAAHEVAHLKHMNHGRAFWRLVLTHCPDAAHARDWLKRHGAGLHRFGV